jgi:hypothetical protein
MSPEEIEIDTDKLHEAVHEELERAGGSLLRQIALTTAVLAAFAAVAALQAGDTVNEALVLKTEATRLQAAASDGWAYYQAKGIKAAVEEASAAAWRAAGKTPPPELAQEAQRYKSEQADIERDAREKEKERDAKSYEADVLMRHHHGYARSVTLFQVGIALGAVAALTRMRGVWYASLVTGLIGVALFVMAYYR